MRPEEMKIDGAFYAQPGDEASEVRRIAGTGYDGVCSLEDSWDPFYPLAMAAEHAPSQDIESPLKAHIENG